MMIQFLEINSGTWTVTLIGWAIVFVALVVLLFVFTIVPKIHQLGLNLHLKREGKLNKGEAVDIHDLKASDNAAIAFTLLHYFNEMHDEESGVITIKKVRKRYSPWNSKLYGMNNRGF